MYRTTIMLPADLKAMAEKHARTMGFFSGTVHSQCP
jgi:hypothetical protein